MEEQLEEADRGFDRLFTSPHFERVRDRLIRIFARRGCAIPEDLADETLGRVTAKLPEIGPRYKGDPVHFVYAVARNVYLEFMRRPRSVPLGKTLETAQAPVEEDGIEEKGQWCLEGCMARLSAHERRLITEYYLFDKGAKIDRRKRLAAELGIGMNALRIRACRIRQGLQGCVTGCLDGSAGPEMKSDSLHYGA